MDKGSHLFFSSTFYRVSFLGNISPMITIFMASGALMALTPSGGAPKINGAHPITKILTLPPRRRSGGAIPPAAAAALRVHPTNSISRC